MACDAQAALAGSEPPQWLEVDCVRLKGKRAGVTLFTAVAAEWARKPSFADETRLWQLARRAWHLQHWAQAAQALEELRLAHPSTPFAALYAQLEKRIEHHQNQPPAPDWDGVHDFEAK